MSCSRSRRTRRAIPCWRCTARCCRASGRLRWFGYLSTTGVYGDRGGDWVDEQSDLQPTGERGRRRVAAEVGWSRLLHAEGLPLHVFRLAGIYGPGRSALDSLRAGTAKRVIKPGQVFSRIHVADIAQVLRASMARPNPGAVYNVCDDDPAPPWEVIEYAAELLGVAAAAGRAVRAGELSDMARSFYDDNKRVRNERIKRELGVQLMYPSYREGLRALSSSIHAIFRKPCRGDRRIARLAAAPLAGDLPVAPTERIRDISSTAANVRPDPPSRLRRWSPSLISVTVTSPPPRRSASRSARLPGHVGIGHAVQQAHGAADSDGRRAAGDGAGRLRSVRW